MRNEFGIWMAEGAVLENGRTGRLAAVMTIHGDGACWS